MRVCKAWHVPLAGYLGVWGGKMGVITLIILQNARARSYKGSHVLAVGWTIEWPRVARPDVHEPQQT